MHFLDFGFPRKRGRSQPWKALVSETNQASLSLSAPPSLTPGPDHAGRIGSQHYVLQAGWTNQSPISGNRLQITLHCTSPRFGKDRASTILGTSTIHRHQEAVHLYDPLVGVHPQLLSPTSDMATVSKRSGSLLELRKSVH